VRPLWIWLAALALYLAFLAWYDGLRSPLEAEEIERHLETIERGGEFAADRLAVLRGFLEGDDGDEFFMVNLIQLHEEPVAMPESGEAAPASEVLARYTGHFMPALLQRAGHPAFLGPAAARYVEAWGVEPDPGWSFTGVVRYRSRRDMIELATDPAFGPAHAYKIAAMPRTFAFPVAPGRVVFGVRPFVLLTLALVAALAQLAFARRR